MSNWKKRVSMAYENQLSNQYSCDGHLKIKYFTVGRIDPFIYIISIEEYLSHHLTLLWNLFFFFFGGWVVRK